RPSHSEDQGTAHAAEDEPDVGRLAARSAFGKPNPHGDRATGFRRPDAMSEPHAKSGWRRFRNYVLLAGLVGLILLGALSWYATTDSFQALVRRRAVAELERITGGRVDLGGIHTVPFHFQVEIRDLTIHGREAASEVPYAHIDRLIARVKLISTLGAEFGFSSLVLDRPIIHIILY